MNCQIEYEKRERSKLVKQALPGIKTAVWNWLSVAWNQCLSVKDQELNLRESFEVYFMKTKRLDDPEIQTAYRKEFDKLIKKFLKLEVENE